MVLEDFTTYTEVDPNSHIEKTAYHIDYEAWTNEDAWVVKDCLIDHFEDFEHLVDVRIVSGGDEGTSCAGWALANEVNDLRYFYDTANKVCLFVRLKRELDRTYNITLYEYYHQTLQADVFPCSADRWYYLTIKKAGTALTCKVYSNPARTNLLHTLSITLSADHKFRYVYGVDSYNHGAYGPLDVDIKNLDLQEVVVKAKPASIIPLMRVMDLISAVKPFSKRFPKFKPRLVA